MGIWDNSSVGPQPCYRRNGPRSVKSWKQQRQILGHGALCSLVTLGAELLQQWLPPRFGRAHSAMARRRVADDVCSNEQAVTSAAALL